MAPHIEESFIKARYLSPNETKKFDLGIPSKIPKPDSQNFVKEKSMFISELRSNAKSLQEQMNSFLTEKMTEDKLRNRTIADSHFDEEEEQNYGEEKVEDEN